MSSFQQESSLTATTKFDNQFLSWMKWTPSSISSSMEIFISLSQWSKTNAWWIFSPTFGRTRMARIKSQAQVWKNSRTSTKMALKIMTKKNST